MAWQILVQEQVRSEFFVIDGVGGKDPTQMGLSKDDDMIEAFPADRADQSLRVPPFAKVSAALSGDPGCPSLRDAW